MVRSEGAQKLTTAGSECAGSDPSTLRRQSELCGLFDAVVARYGDVGRLEACEGDDANLGEDQSRLGEREQGSASVMKAYTKDVQRLLVRSSGTESPVDDPARTRAAVRWPKHLQALHRE